MDDTALHGIGHTLGLPTGTRTPRRHRLGRGTSCAGSSRDTMQGSYWDPDFGPGPALLSARAR